jgi:glycosyltransferase involved in cell wall biosynthesis
MKPLVLIPARNEAATIENVVTGCLKHVPRVIVIADGCSDATVFHASAAGAEVWAHPGAPGKAVALRWAWEKLRNDRTWTHLVLLDGDGQHDPRDIPCLLERAEADVLVIGSRAPFAPPMPWHRRWVNRVMSMVVGWLARTPVPDSQSGFRVLPRPLVEEVSWTSTRFEIESEMVLKARQAGCSVVSVAVGCHYAEGARPSHIAVWDDTCRWMGWVGRSLASLG